MDRLIWTLLATVSLTTAALAHAGHGSPKPWLACAEQARGDKCSWNDGHDRLFAGTCRPINDRLMCVRNQPIITLPPKAATGALARLAAVVSPLALSYAVVHTPSH